MIKRVRLPLIFVALLSATVCGAQDAASSPTTPAPLPYPSQGALADRIAAIVQAPGVARAHWGVAVTTMDGTPLFGLNEGQYFRPASNAKLFTTAAAMALLHADATFTTKIYGKLDPATGTVDGDLVLVGGGDPSFGSGDLPYVAPGQRPKNPPPPPPALQDLREMVDQLVAKGVKRVTGRIVGDDTLFPYEPYPGSWDAGDAVWGYGAPVSALTIADNQMLLTIPPGTLTGSRSTPIQHPASAMLEQQGVDFYFVKNEVRVTPAGFGSHADVERLPGSRTLRTFGEMAVDSAPDVEHVAVDEPALYAAMVLRKMLVDKGITVDSAASVQHKPFQPPPGAPGATNSDAEDGVLAGGVVGLTCVQPSFPGSVLATHVSAPLSADILFTNKVSQNLHAEILLHQLGRYIACNEGSGRAGTRMVRAFLKRAGLDPADFLFYDGSGLSSHDIVTPRATAKLLSYASTQPWFAQWKASLPSGGEDGTLRSRFGDKSVLKGHIYAKTGTLGESRALSGYLDAASGKTLIFSVFVDTHTPTTSADRVAMDAIVEAIAAAN